jgi:hypothetical protein
MQNLALKLLAFAVVMEHGLACKLHSFAVVVEDEPFISKTDLIREATFAEEHVISISCSRMTRGSKPTAAISDLEAILQLFQAASTFQSVNLSAAKFILYFNFVVLTHSCQLSVMSIFSQSLQLPPLPYALLPTQLMTQDLLPTCSAGGASISATSLSPQQLIPCYNLLHSSSAGVTLFISVSSPAQPTSFDLLLQPSAGDPLQLAIAFSTANFASAQLHRYRSLLICLTRSNFLTTSLSLMQLLYLNVLPNRLAGDILSRFKDIPDAFLILRPPGSLICSAGDYPSRPHRAHRLNDFQLMTFSSALHTTSELYLCMPSIYFRLLHSELPIASLLLESLPSIFKQSFVFLKFHFLMLRFSYRLPCRRRLTLLLKPAFAHRDV